MPATVTVTYKDDNNRVTVYEAELPAEQAQELALATTAIRRMQPAEVFLRMSSLGLDLFIKELGHEHLKRMVTELRQLLDN
jgi:hypothetical protein